jgi:IclR family acetate operon transcriptional repressor
LVTQPIDEVVPRPRAGEAATPRIQSLARADAILTVVMRSGDPVTPLSRIAADLRLNKTTVFNLAESLVALGLLSRSEDPKGYRLGLRCLELGRHVTKNLPVLEISRPYLRELCQFTRETVNLPVPYLQEAIIVEALQSQQAVRATAYAGARSHYHSSACGKAMLAHFPQEQRDWLYRSVGLKRMTSHTICRVDALEADLAETRTRGYALDQQENEIGAFCIGMPLFGPFNEIVGSISVSGVMQRMTPDFVQQIVGQLSSRTRRISKELGRA